MKKYLLLHSDIALVLLCAEILGQNNFISQIIQNFIQQPAVKVNSICRGNYWGSSM